MQTNNKVEDGRVRAHETAEAATDKVHVLIDKLAEQAVVGGERMQEFQTTAAQQAEAAKKQAASRAADLREQAEASKKQAAKDAKKKRKKARKAVKSTKKDMREDVRKSREQARRDIEAVRQSLREDVLPRAKETASGLAAAGAEAGRRAADQASARGPEVMTALRENQDPKAALAAARGEQQEPQKKKRGKLKFLLLALVVGGLAAFVAKQKSQPKKDPWAVPAGDPYKAPTTGRETSVPAADTGAAGAAADGGPTTGAAAGAGVGASAAAGADAEGTTAGEQGVGDAWSSARDWADSSSVPSTTGHVDNEEDLEAHNLGEDGEPKA